jgi:hypothetical protein
LFILVNNIVDPLMKLFPEGPPVKKQIEHISELVFNAK